MPKMLKANYQGKSQGNQIIQFLTDNKSISPMEAYTHLGCSKLATRISELKRKGYQFSSHDETVKARFGNKATYKRYKLVGLPPV